MNEAKTILIVEDEALIALAQKKTLQKYGYEVITATSGEKAIEKVRVTPHIALVLMDIDLGRGMDGTQAAQIILKDHDIPIVFLSSRIERDIVEKIKEITSYGYVVKDSGETALIASIKMAFKLFGTLQKHRESEKRYRTILNTTMDGFWAISLSDRRFTDVNDAFCRMAGYSRDELLRLSINDVDALKSPDEQAAIIQTIIAKGSGIFERRLQRKDGTVFVVELSATYQNTSNGELIGFCRDITNRNQVEQMLKQQTDAMNASIDGIAILNEKQNYIYVNEAHAEIYGYNTFEELIGRSWRLLYDEDELLRFDHSIMPEFNQKGRWQGEAIGKKKDGSTFVQEISLTALGDGGLICVARDISERKRAEDDLQASQQIINAILNAIPVRVFWKDKNLVYLGCNTIFARDAGFDDPKDIIGKDDYQMVWQDQAESYRSDDLQVIASGCAKLSIEEPQTTPDGNTITLLTSKIPLHNSNGETIGVLGTYMDITDRKKIEKTLQESEEQFRKMFEGNPLGMIMVGSDFRFIRANAAFCRMLGYTNKELTSLTFKDITHPDHIAQDVRQVTDLMNGKIPLYRTEKLYVRKDRTVVWGSIRVNVMRDRDGRFLYFFTTVEDITQRKQSEEERAHLESQLLQSQKMEAIGTLAGGIAHDFNNLLTVISGFASLLKMDMEKGDTREAYIDQILTSSEKAAQLTKSLLAFSRKQQIILQPLDINNTIKATSKLLKRLLTEDIELKIKLSKKNSIIMADTTQIDQILFNLATNARDVMPHGGTLIIETNVVELNNEFINAHRYGAPGEYVLLSVTDTGSGMDEATRERIFEPFFTTKEMGKGTGLGLSTVYGIVKQHNGYINVYSEPDIGTTVHIYLPVVNEISREDEDIQVPVKGGNETILIAEDSAGVRGFIGQILNAHGYAVIEAIDGADAIEQFKKTDKIDLLIFDSVMPKKNGREAYDEIHKINPHIRVIFTSGYTKDVFLDKGIEDEEFNFLQKPISGDILLQKVREVLDFGKKRP